ncbi:MAG TPA: ABC transporter permease [Terriglobales bacterium]|nr:ABC transporter permease [Terriglobales bacterium]
MRALLQHVATILITLLIGGFLGASLVRFSPGFGVDEAELDPHRSPGSIAAIRQESGANENIVAFYFHYLQRMAHGDLGTSRTLNRPVAELIRERLPETMKSVVLGLGVGWALGFALAIPAVMLRSRLADVSASAIAGSLLCVPAGVFALIFVLLRAPGRFVVALIIFPKVFRFARNLLVRSAELPHVLTARVKGLSEIRIFFWHILPSVGPQLLALAGVSVSLAFAATIPVEVLCDLPGIGQLAWNAALGRDLYLLVNLTLIVTVITLIANTTADLAKPRRSEA